MSKVNDYIIERVHLGEASDAERAVVAASPEARERLEALAEADARFQASHDPDEQLATIRRKAHLQATRDAVAARRSRLGWAGAGAVVLAVAAGVLVARPSLEPVEAETVHDGRAKGLGAALVVHRKAEDGQQVLRDGDLARAGDVLQLGYRAVGAAHGVVLSVDGRGAVTLHYPASVGGSTGLQRGGEIELGHGYQLDDAPRFERFFFVTSAAPIDVAEVVAAAEALAAEGQAGGGSLQVEDLDEFTVLVRKESR